jgi:hypothetical protein
MQQQSEVVGEIRASTISERAQLTINVQRQRWKKNNKDTFRMKFLKYFLVYFFFYCINAQTEKKR